jgi:hypothetical protein
MRVLRDAIGMWRDPRIDPDCLSASVRTSSRSRPPFDFSRASISEVVYCLRARILKVLRTKKKRRIAAAAYQMSCVSTTGLLG